MILPRIEDILVKRICFISHSAYGYFNEDAPAGGGAQRQFHLLSTALTSKFDVHFIVGDYGQSLKESRQGVTLHRSYTPERSSTIFQQIQKLFQLRRAMRRADADVYITRCQPRKFVFIFLLAKSLRRNLVYHVATDSFVSVDAPSVDGVLNRLYAKALRSSTVVAQTSYQADELRTNWGVDATVIPNGYPPASVVDLHHTRDYFLWVGRFDKEEKRPHLFLELADELPQEEFILIGGPEKEGEYGSRIIERAEAMENVKYPGKVSPSEIHGYYRRAVALVNTSTKGSEGFPNTFLEAWRFATPVLSLSVCPTRFLDTGNGNNGYADDDFEKLVLLSQQIADDVFLRRQRGSLGMYIFQKNYQISAVVDEYLTLLRTCLPRGFQAQDSKLS